MCTDNLDITVMSDDSVELVELFKIEPQTPTETETIEYKGGYCILYWGDIICKVVCQIDSELLSLAFFL